ncbi:MAG: SpoIID/LytB domain-containing protein [Candidatus Cloacimonadaceae bacterium]|nr:SpoIID/LytB domain-containing protein [Candidatus Cloacimonadaceae bacterium]MDP3113723.1 SpoIID/LytB domain-containing protein [Candidatus Cloacimonadaceae bacterium]
MIGLTIFLYAAQYRDGSLWLEILLNSGSEITLKAKSVSTPRFNIAEIDSPISRQIDGNLSIKLMDADKVAFWGFLNRVEPINKHSLIREEDLIREFFAWADSQLVIRREKLIFEPTTFSAYESAKTYASQTGIPHKQILSIPMLNTTVRIVSGTNTYYFETPILIKTENELFINGASLGFSGEFILKSIGESLIINHFLPLEDYVGGVIQNEIGSSAPIEALKAQAVAARTHAISLLLYNRHKNDGYDLCNGTHCQVYKGMHLSNNNIIRSVHDTKNQIMVFGERVADATYHSSCGGKTDSSANIWKGTPLPFLMGVSCWEECDSLDLTNEKNARAWIDTKVSSAGASSWERATLSWEKTVSRSTLENNLGIKGLRHIGINKRGNSGRIVSISFYGDKKVTLDSEYRIRQVFGELSSSFFYIKGGSSVSQGADVIKATSTLQLRGKGSGHGVGMCQVGALKRARNGASFTDILQTYYPGIVLSDRWLQSDN